MHAPTPWCGDDFPESVARYDMRGDELYVRARVRSSKPKANPSFAGEMEMAWTQPVHPR